MIESLPAVLLLPRNRRVGGRAAPAAARPRNGAPVRPTGRVPLDSAAGLNRQQKSCPGTVGT